MTREGPKGDHSDKFMCDDSIDQNDTLDRDIQQILKLMPDKVQDEVQYMLESHQKNPSRVQVVLNEFLEQSEEPTKAKASETSPIPIRNKVGNGLKAKNSKKKSSCATDPKGDHKNEFMSEIIEKPIHEEKKIESIHEKKKLEQNESNEQSESAEQNETTDQNDQNNTLEESEENEITEKLIHEEKKIEHIHEKKKLECIEQNESKEQSESTEQSETIEQNDSIDQNDTVDENKITDKPINKKKKIEPTHEKKKLECIEQNESNKQSESTEQNETIEQNGSIDSCFVNLKRSKRKKLFATNFSKTKMSTKPPSPFNSPSKPKSTFQSANCKNRFGNQNEINDKPIHEEKKIEPIHGNKKQEYIEQNESNEQSESTEQNETIEQNDSIDQIQLDTHIESGHVKKSQKTFPCSYCDKIFNLKSTLKEF